MEMKLMTTAFAATAALAVLPDPARADIQRRDFRIQGEPGITLAVREVARTEAGRERVPVILLHGARVPGVASFDLPVDGGSFAADLARAGHRVFIMDARGYGGSSRPGQDGPKSGDALVRSDEVVRDLGAVVNSVQVRTGASRVALLGWATGAHWAGMYASRNPDHVSHLVIYNGLYGAHAGHKTLGPGSDTADPSDPARFNSGKFGAYQEHTAESLLPSWDKSIPSDDKTAWRDPGLVKAYQQAALASDPVAANRNPPAFRAPSGAMADSFELASGRKLWDATTITARVLVLRSERDFWSRPEDVTTLERDLTNAANVRAVTIPDATHYVHLDRAEKGRAAFVAEVGRFLDLPMNSGATTQ
jgi:pimeloyl-ACP methyl ester carboxylesterase